jgi:hypothetical protein
MTTLREAAQQALEALENTTPTRFSMKRVKQFFAAITALRAALAQEEQGPISIGLEWKPCVKLPVTVHVREQRPEETHVSTREGITPIKPDDLIMRGVAGEEYPIGRELFERTYRLGEAQPKQEQPVGWLESPYGAFRANPLYRMTAPQALAWKIPLYTHPPRREWRGLSEEEIVDAVRESDLDWHQGWTLDATESNRYAQLVRAVEAALKERNHG